MSSAPTLHLNFLSGVLFQSLAGCAMSRLAAVRDHAVMALEEGVRSLSQALAALMGLKDRRVIGERYGHRASWRRGPLGQV